MPTPEAWDELDPQTRDALERRVLDAVSDFFAGEDDSLARLPTATPAETEELAHSFWDLGLGDLPPQLRGAPRVLRVSVHAHLEALFWEAFGAGVRAAGGAWDPAPLSRELAADALPQELERAEVEDRLERDGRVKALQWLAARRGVSTAEAVRLLAELLPR